MAKCISCGKSGLFLKLQNGLCLKCQENQHVTHNKSEFVTQDFSPQKYMALLDKPNYVELIDTMNPTPQERSDAFFLVHMHRVGLIDTTLANTANLPLSSIEQSFLKYINGKAIDGKSIAGYWTHEHNLNYRDVIAKLLGQNLLCIEKDKFRLTEAGKNIVDVVPTSASKDIGFEDECLNLILSGNINEAYKKRALQEANKPAPGGVFVGSDMTPRDFWKQQAKDGLETETEKIYASYMEQSEADLPQELENDRKIICACVILGQFIGGKGIDLLIKRKIGERANKLPKGFSQGEIVKLQSATQINDYKRLGTKYYQIIVALDSQTCSDCGKNDLKVFKVAEAKIGVNFPPFHIGCRCATTPESDPNDEIFGGIWDDDPTTRAARDAKGESISVDGKMTYTEWAKKYSQ